MDWRSKKSLPRGVHSYVPQSASHPEIWATPAATRKIWTCQFAYGQYGLTGQGKTRAEACGDLMLQHDAMLAKQSN